MSPEEYAALKAAASVKLYRDANGNYLYDANQAKTGVFPRDIIEQLEKLDETETATRAQRHIDIQAFITDLKEAG
jgi:hypothetical protein